MRDVVVLAYHAVAASTNPLAVDEEALQAQVLRLLRRGRRPVTFLEAVLGCSSRPAFAVTFDDGFRSVHSRALPVLADLGVPATAFVVTGLVGGDGPLDWRGFAPAPMGVDELVPMSWEEVRELDAHGWEIGSHTVTHRRLPTLSEQDRRGELEGSRQTLEEQLGSTPTSLAYPFGQADVATVESARATGYLAAATMSYRPCPGPLAVPRTGVYSHDSLARFSLKVARPMRTRAAAVALAGYHRVR